MERYALLKTLYRKGINSFDVTRLEGGHLPASYPVFVRDEDGTRDVESGLCGSADELMEAIGILRESGKVLKRRIAVEFCAEPDSAGYYRKYGAFNINGTIVPQHLLFSRQWEVKYESSVTSESLADEEFEYIRSNPHRNELLRIFGIANIGFGRIDYGIVDGAIQVYEINTNPHFPWFDSVKDARTRRRQVIQEQLAAAFQAVNISSPKGDPVRFASPSLRHHRMRRPRLLRRPLWVDRSFPGLRRTGLYQRLKDVEKQLRKHLRIARRW
jgi:hypothetical protein